MSSIHHRLHPRRVSKQGNTEELLQPLPKRQKRDNCHPPGSNPVISSRHAARISLWDRCARENGKLLLVLDLDQTLLHSYVLTELHEAPVLDPLREIHVVSSVGVVTRLRPFAREFLRKASPMYDMYIYTMGTRDYADAMAALLDPEGEYFGAKGNNDNYRVFCRDDCTVEMTKGLDVVTRLRSSVVVLDDSPDVWAMRDRPNIVHMKRYFWDPKKKNDDDDDGGLLKKISILVERIYLEQVPDLGPRYSSDVRLIMRRVRSEILQGCSVLFTEKPLPAAPPTAGGKERSWSEMAVEMGAKTELPVSFLTPPPAASFRTPPSTASVRFPDLTHFICYQGICLEELRWAVDSCLMAVELGWLEEAYFTWERAQEAKFGSNKVNRD